MKKITLLVTFLVVGAFSLASCIVSNDTKMSGKMVEENRTTGSFSNISSKCMCDVYFVQGNTTSVIIKGNKELVESTTTKVNNGTLEINCDKNFSWHFNMTTVKLEVYITSPNISKVSLSGSGNFVANSAINAGALSFGITGSGDISLGDVKCDAFDTYVSGSGDVRIKNITCQQASYKISGSGDMAIGQNYVKNTLVKISGSGDIRIKGNNCGTISGNVSGSGDINLSGSFTSKHIKTSGSGDVNIE